MQANGFLGELGFYRDKVRGWKSSGVDGRYLVVLDRTGEVCGMRQAGGEVHVVFRTENVDVSGLLELQASWVMAGVLPADVG